MREASPRQQLFFIFFIFFQNNCESRRNPCVFKIKKRTPLSNSEVRLDNLPSQLILNS